MALAWSGHANAPDLLWRTLRPLTTPWLLIIDNANQPEALLTGADERESATWLRKPRTQHGTVLVTSRNGSPHAWGPHALRVQVATLSGEDGALMLLDLTGSQAGPQHEAVALATRLGGLPLALRSAGTYLAAAATAPRIPELTVPRTFAAYRACLDEGFGELVDAVPPGRSATPTDQDLLTRICELSLNLLVARGLPLARPLLRLLACLGPAAVLDDMLIPNILRRMTPLAGVTPQVLLDTLQGLLDVNLVERITGADGDGVALHPVLREILRAGPADPQSRPVLIALLEELTGALDPWDPANWQRWRSLLPHCLEIVPEDPTDLTGGRTTLKPTHQRYWPAWQATAVLGRAARYCEAIGQFELAVSLYRRVWSSCRALLGARHNDTMVAHNHLADALMAGGSGEEALREYRALERTQRAALGDIHPDTLLVQYNIAQLTRRPEDFAVVLRGARTRAEQEMTQIADLRRRVPQVAAMYVPSLALPEHLPARRFLAMALAESGELTAAEAEYRTLADYHASRSGPFSAQTLAARVNLATVLYDKGEAAAAEAELQAVCRARQRLLDKHDPALLSVRQSLATVHDALGNVAAALAETEAVLAVQQEVLGPDHPDTLNTRANRALITVGSADREAVDRELREVRQELERALGECHTKTLIVRSYSAAALLSWGEIEAAEAEYRAVLAAFRASLGDRHPNTLLCRRNLADIFVRRGDVPAAIAEYRAVLAGQREQLGLEHQQTKETQARLAENPASQ